MKEDRKTRVTLAGTLAYARWSPVNHAWLVLLGEDLTTAKVLAIRQTRYDVLDLLKDYVRDGWFVDILAMSEER